MIKLVVKDLALARPFLLVGVPLLALQLFGLAVSPPAFFLVTLLLAGLLAFGSLAIEEVQGTEILWCSLPVSRREIVFARYLTTLLGLCGGLGVSWATGRLATSGILGGVGQTAPRIPLAPYGVISILLLLGGALFLPCYFRFGAGRGLVLFAALIAGLAFLLTFLGWVAALVGGHSSLLRRDPDPETLRRVRGWLDVWALFLGAGLMAGALTIFAASAALAARVYELRDR